MRNKDNFIFFLFTFVLQVLIQGMRSSYQHHSPTEDKSFYLNRRGKQYLEFIYRFQLILMPQSPVYLWWRFSTPSTLYPGVLPHSGQLFASFVAGIVAIRIHIRIAFSQNTSVSARPEILCETGRTMLTPGECFPFSGVTVSFHS